MRGIALFLVPHLRPDCALGGILTPKLRVVLHYPLLQLLNQLLADDDILLARQFCDCFRDRVDDRLCLTRLSLGIRQ
jgi:hypothetical protein